MKSIQDELILDDPDRGIVLPQVHYHTYAQISQETVFKGSIVPVPVSVIPYFKGTELKVFMIILNDIREHTMCYKSQAEIGKILGITNIAVSHSIHSLINMGVIEMIGEGVAKRNARKKIINWEAIEFMCKLFDNCKPDAARKLRDYVGDKNLKDLTDDQKDWFRLNCKVFNDPDEDEEYN